MQNHDSEEREYAEDNDQIREVLIHENYLSQKDIEICLAFDLDDLVGHAHEGSMRLLHDALTAGYAVEGHEGVGVG